MPFNGAGQFFRTFSWTADKAAGLDISSSRMDTDSLGMPIEHPQSCDARELDRAPRSAALVISSAAVRMTGVPCSDDGTVLTRIASRNDASLTSLGSSMGGSAKRL
jgi:hypothetical protein